MSRIVITGGPGVGKTTLLLALQARGFTVVGDSARAIIQGRRRQGLSPRPTALEFALEVLRMDVQNHALHESTPGRVFFDRGVVDALCMVDQAAPLSDGDLHERLAKYPYSPKVFVLPPWQAIYANDSERDQSFEQAEAVNTQVLAWYRRCRYRIVEVPRLPVAERCAFVRQALG